MIAKRLKLILVLMFPLTVFAQELEFVDLGIVEGEFKQLKRELIWVNSTSEDLMISAFTKSSKIELNEGPERVPLGDTLSISIDLTLPSAPGYYEYEVQLVAPNKILVHGFHLGLQVLAPEIDVFKAYRNIHWPFRTKEQIFNLKAAYKGDTLKAMFDVYNLGGENLKLDDVIINDSTWVTFEPKEIKHNQFGHMTLQMLTSDKSPSGFQKVNFELKQATKTLANLPVQFTLMPKKPYTDDELVSGGPAITSSVINHDFKELSVGDVETTTITLANVGNDELFIEKLESNCECLTHNLQKLSLKSGESQSFQVTFNAKGRIGLERKTLAIFSNDPTNPTLVITFRAHVK